MNIKIPTNKTKDECYKAGFDCGTNGANPNNCNSTYFATSEKTTWWEEGKHAAEIKQHPEIN